MQDFEASLEVSTAAWYNTNSMQEKRHIQKEVDHEIQSKTHFVNHRSCNARYVNVKRMQLDQEIIT